MTVFMVSVTVRASTPQGRGRQRRGSRRLLLVLCGSLGLGRLGLQALRLWQRLRAIIGQPIWRLASVAVVTSYGRAGHTWQPSTGVTGGDLPQAESGGL